jgi:bleomycin hydrolase
MKKYYLEFLLLAISLPAMCQDITDSTYHFTDVKSLPATSVKNQNQTGTCWSFSTLSMFESELLRTGKGEVDLSPMFVAHKAYELKAYQYVSREGKAQFSQGGEANDVANVFEQYGIVPLSVYSGLTHGDTLYNHNELESVLQSILTSVNKQKNLTLAWKEALGSVIDAYLGKIPASFTYKGKSYTPQTYAQSLGLNMSDYVLLTSYNTHPWYSSFALDIADNWSGEKAKNIPLDELTKVVKNAIQSGYTVAWASDVSERSFFWSKGVAIWPMQPFQYTNGTKLGKDKANAPLAETEASDSIRVVNFDRRLTTDDHGMHIVGIAKDQLGKEYFKVKNSWGTDNPYKGYIYVSEPYFKMKTMSIYVNKNAIPSDIRKKLKL